MGRHCRETALSLLIFPCVDNGGMEEALSGNNAVPIISRCKRGRELMNSCNATDLE